MFLGFMVYRVFAAGLGLPLWGAALLTVGGGALLGLLIYGVAIAPRPGYGPMNLTFRCIGVSLLLTALANRLWAHGQPYSLEGLINRGTVHLFGVNVGFDQIGVLVVTIMIGFPVAFTMMALGVGFGYYAYFQGGQAFFDNRVFYLLRQNTYGVMTNDTLVSVPLFLFMGYMVERANILDKLFFSLQVALRFLPGALAVAAIATCALFATATGIVGAVVTLMGLLAFPQMLKAGYETRYASGAICAGGCLGILIPPSILLIVYGAQAGVSVVRLYAGALIPGFLLAGLYILYLIVYAAIKPEVAPKLPKEQTNVPFLKTMWLLTTSFFPLALLILSVLGTIMSQAYLSGVETLRPAIDGLLANIPPAFAEQAQQIWPAIESSIQGAHIVANRMAEVPLVPAEIPQQIIDTSNAAFMTGMNQAMLVGSLIMIATAVLTYFILPAQVRRSEEDVRAEAEREAGRVTPVAEPGGLD